MVAIYYGEKLCEYVNGYCANLCCICLRVTVHLVHGYTKDFHVQMISFSSTALEERTYLCMECLRFTDEPIPDSSVVCPTNFGLEKLLAEVPDDIQKHWKRFVKHEMDLARGIQKLSQEERTLHFLEITGRFESGMDFHVSDRPKPMGLYELGWFSVLACAMALVVSVFVFFPWFVNAHKKLMLGVAMSFIVTIPLTIIWIDLGRKYRYFRDVVYPNLAALLAPFEPTYSELRQIKKLTSDRRWAVSSFRVSKLARKIDEAKALIPDGEVNKNNMLFS